MSLQVSPETEVRLTEAAQQQGTPVDGLLERFLSERPTHAALAGDVRGLPIWRLGQVGALRRRDLYDDVS